MCVEQPIVKWYSVEKKERAFGWRLSLFFNLWGDGGYLVRGE